MLSFALSLGEGAPPMLSGFCWREQAHLLWLLGSTQQVVLHQHDWTQVITLPGILSCLIQSLLSLGLSSCLPSMCGCEMQGYLSKMCFWQIPQIWTKWTMYRLGTDVSCLWRENLITIFLKRSTLSVRSVQCWDVLSSRRGICVPCGCLWNHVSIIRRHQCRYCQQPLQRAWCGDGQAKQLFLRKSWGMLLRIGEVLNAKRSDVVHPQDVEFSIDNVLLKILEPKTRFRAARHQSSKLEPPDLIAVVWLGVGKLRPYERIWPCSSSTLRSRLDKVLARLLPNKESSKRNLTLASFRLGGATYLISLTEDFAEGDGDISPGSCC